MKDAKRRIRQEKLARLFYEMGMDVNLISKVCGIEKNKVVKFSNKNN